MIGFIWHVLLEKKKKSTEKKSLCANANIACYNGKRCFVHETVTNWRFNASLKQDGFVFVDMLCKTRTLMTYNRFSEEMLPSCGQTDDAAAAAVRSKTPAAAPSRSASETLTAHATI